MMKSFEKIVLKYMLPQVEHLLDPLQFAYRAKRSVEDATLSLLNVILEHLERRGSYARIVFVDFSSAFNTISRVFDTCVYLHRSSSGVCTVAIVVYHVH